MPRQVIFSRWKLVILLFILFLGQLLACGEKRQPMEVVTTTNYCQGKITASSQVVKPGDIALSHDLERKYKLKFGDLIYVEGEPEPYVFADRMPAQWQRHVDLYTRSCKTAKEYGIKKRMLWFVRKR